MIKFFETIFGGISWGFAFSIGNKIVFGHTLHWSRIAGMIVSFIIYSILSIQEEGTKNSD